MSNRILQKSTIADGICRFTIEAPKIAKKRKAGNFVIVRANEFAERIPLTIVDSDLDRGSITLIVQSIGKSTRLLNSLKAGDEIADVIGPLGHATPLDNFGTVVCVGGGVGTAEVLPIARAARVWPERSPGWSDRPSGPASVVPATQQPSPTAIARL